MEIRLAIASTPHVGNMQKAPIIYIVTLCWIFPRVDEIARHSQNTIEEIHKA